MGTAAASTAKNLRVVIEPRPVGSRASYIVKTNTPQELEAVRQFFMRLSNLMEVTALADGPVCAYAVQHFEPCRTAFADIEAIARNDAERRQICTWRAASYLHEGDIESAFDEIQRRYDIAAETDDRGAMYGDLNLMGDIILRAGRADEAAEKYQAQIEMIHSSEATEEVKEAADRNQKYDLARVALWKGEIDAASELADAYRTAVEDQSVRYPLALKDASDD